MKKTAGYIIASVLIILMIGYNSVLSYADAEKEIPFPILDSLGQYDSEDYFFSGQYYSRSGFVYCGIDQDQVVTEIERDENERVTRITQYYPPDPGMGTLQCEYTYDTEGRFTEIHVMVENSELETIYGYPKKEKRLTFHYNKFDKQDRRRLFQFEISSVSVVCHGEVYYGSEGNPLSGTLAMEMRWGDPCTYQEEVDFTATDYSSSFLESFLIGVLDDGQEAA